jgi:hypothetical protein
LQVIRALEIEKYGWRHHPVVKMWEGYKDALKEYKNAMIIEWINRGYKNNMSIDNVALNIDYPPWLGNDELHASHRSNLLQKDFEYYSQYNWEEEPGRDYIWIVPEEKL